MKTMTNDELHTELGKVNQARKSQELEEEIETTCCGDEITDEVRDIGLCPTCLEHI
jgi:hypothetical protein|tara:strand:- start:317 stop:484 length:168 start_codon:yes stop_codon:yes gene_type:complete